MKGKDIELLLRDLCARLPYGVKVWNSEFLDPIEECYPNETLTLSNLDYYIKESIEVKPYLRPMSSMTEEEREKFNNVLLGYPSVDWLNANHFDYRGLIEKGLALKAPKGMYKTE